MVRWFSMSGTRVRLAARWIAIAVALFVILGVWVTHQFPSLTASPRTSVELLESLFKAPARMVAEPVKYVIDRVKREAVVHFIRSSDLPSAAEGRLVAMVRGERFKEVTVPFVFYLYELYGTSLKADEGALAGLAYAEPARKAEAGEKDAGPSSLVKHSPELRKHVSAALRLFDALFLRGRPEEGDEEIKRIFREVAGQYLIPSDDALSRPTVENEVKAGIEKVLRDDERLTDFVEFFSDFVRDLSDGWLRPFVRTEQRKERRLAWVEEAIAGNRYYEIADYARARADRKLVFHLAVDGLQGKLLEGLAQLSAGDRESSGARYVMDLVRLHQAPRARPSPGRPGTPAGLGKDLLELAEKAPKKPGYLENFKKYFFSPEAQAVTVNVATVDTPSISVRNLPIIYSGHKVAGPFGTGIPNFSYLDRRTGRGWYFWGSDILYMRRIFGNREDLIPGGRKRPEGPGARTLFERLWRYNTVSCMASVDTGALQKISSEVGVAVGELQRNFIEKVIVLRFRQRAEMERDLNKRREWLIEHRGLSRSFLGSLLLSPVELKTFHEYARFLAEHEDEGLPDYMLWFNPWPDHYAHGKGPYSDAIVGFEGEYDRLDFYLGKMIGIYESVETIGGGSTYADRTLFGVVSDHGLIYTPILVSTDELLFEGMRRDGIAVTYLKLTHDEGGLPAIHGRSRIKPTRPYDAVVGSTAGGSYVIDLFDPKSFQEDDAAWRRHPGYHELRRHRLLSGKAIDWIQELKRRLKSTMDLALVREYGPRAGEVWPPEVESVVRIITPDRGEARIYRSRKTGSDGAPSPSILYRYEILGEEDPLDLAGAVRDYLIPPGGPGVDEVRDSLTRCVTSAEGFDDPHWRLLLSYTLRPDVIFQFSHLYDSDRAGTVNVFPGPFTGYNTRVPGRHAGESFGEKNGTQLYRGAGLRKARIQTARNGSLPVTLYHWLVGDDVFHAADPELGVSPADQFGYRSLLGERAFTTLR